MRTSNKIFLITIISILSITVILIISIWLFISHHDRGIVRISRGSSDIISKEYIINDFNSIAISGFIELEIVRDKSYSINLSAPEYLIEQVKVFKSGDRLNIDQIFAGVRPVRIKVIVTLPELTGIKILGNSKADFSNFEINQMVIELSGKSDVLGRNSQINNLKIMGSGLFNIDLNSCFIVNADLIFSGTSDTDLNMAGGKLSGTVNGTHKINYSGKVIEQKIITSGSVKIEKKDRP